MGLNKELYYWSALGFVLLTIGIPNEPTAHQLIGMTGYFFVGAILAFTPQKEQNEGKL